jgi:glycosyltransferase involved in cell wall biosynthesis
MSATPSQQSAYWRKEIRRTCRIRVLYPSSHSHFPQCTGQSRGRPEKITWISNGIDLAMLGEPPGLRQNSEFVGIYAGTHGLANGLDLLLDAAAILQADGSGHKVLFRLIGDGPLKASLVEKAKNMGLHNIRFEDPVPKTDIYSVLAEADFYPVVLRDSPLYQWGISLNKLFDYMAVGRPIVFSGKAPANPLETSRSGIITKPGDAVDFANGIRRLLEMSVAEREQLSRRARRCVEKHFAIPVLVDELEAVFKFVHNEYTNS